MRRERGALRVKRNTLGRPEVKVEPGSRERKRQGKAAPLPGGRHLPWGCVVSAVAYLLLCGGLLAVSGWVGFVVLAVPVGAGLAYAAVRFAYGVALLALVQRRWASRGLKCLLVHSDSPVWQEHITSEWLPQLGQVSLRLNWSERSQWPSSLEVRLFRRFCFAQYNFNPAVLVFRGMRAPLVFRFFYAFHEAKDGRQQYLQELERELFSALGAERGGPTSG